MPGPAPGEPSGTVLAEEGAPFEGRRPRALSGTLRSEQTDTSVCKKIDSSGEGAWDDELSELQISVESSFCCRIAGQRLA